jgi:HSP20 family protein
MANLSPLDLFSDIKLIDPGRDFADWLRRPVVANPESPPLIRLEVAERNDAYIVKADLPGMNKEDIHVSVDGNKVSIEAEIKPAAEPQRLLCGERYYGKQYRSFSLASEIDDGKAQANYRHGVLELILPKKAGSSAKMLTIQ